MEATLGNWSGGGLHLSCEEDRLFDDLDDLLRAIGDDALSLVMHLNEGIEAFRTQALLIFGLVFAVSIPYLALFISRPEYLSSPEFYLAVVLYVALVLCALWLGVRTMRSYRSYRARYGRMIETAKKFEEAKKLSGRA